jgi:hypothetical protein
MLKLYFDPTRLPRTMTKQEWKEADRWCRVTRKQLEQAAQEQINNLITFGSTMPNYIKRDIMDKMIYPSVVLGPGMEEAMKAAP